MRSLMILVVLGGTAAADSYETHETFGLDVTSIWEPGNADAFGAGPLFRFEFNSTKMPGWLDLVGRWGVVADSADRTYAPFTFGLAARLGRPYVGIDLGMMLHSDEMEEGVRVAWTTSANLGVRLGVWDVRATAMRGELFDGNVWMFSLGRDFARIDSTVRRSFF